MAVFKKPTPASTSWLGDYLADAVARRLCVRVGSTTYGAREFRQGLYTYAAMAVGLATGARKEERILAELIAQLAMLSSTTTDQSVWFDAVRLIFCKICFTVGAPTAKRMYQPMLEGKWAGSVLHSMQERYCRLTGQCRQYELANSPEATQARREEKRMLWQQKYSERLAAKKERDRLWFENHPQDGT
jgi:hypothetical protein